MSTIITQSQQQLRDLFFSLPGGSDQVEDKSEPGLFLHFDGLNLFFYPVDHDHKWEFPAHQLFSMAYDLTRVKLTDMGSNAILRDAVMVVQDNLPLPASTLDPLLCALGVDHSRLRTTVQIEIEKNDFESTALLDPEAVRFLWALFEDPNNIVKMVMGLSFEIEFVLGMPDAFLVEAGYPAGLDNCEEARLFYKNKLGALATILEYYFYLVHLCYYSVSRSARLGFDPNIMQQKKSETHPTSTNPIPVRTSLPVHGYSAIYHQLLNVQDIMCRLLKIGVVDRTMLSGLEAITTRFQIAAYMEMYFMGKVVNWRGTAKWFEECGNRIGRDMATVFKMLGLEEFECEVLGNREIDSVVWQNYYIHRILVDRFQFDWMSSGYGPEVEEEAE